MAITMGSANSMPCNETANVASPSGKLCIAMDSATNSPMRLNFFSGMKGLPMSSTMTASCGLSSSGMRKSISAMSPIPAKNVTVAASMALSPNDVPNDETVVGNMSTKETKSITPAENPKATVRNVVFVLSVKKAIRLPIPVERPAMRVSPKAMSMVYVSISAAICAGMGFHVR